MRFNTFFLDSEHERYQHGWFPDSESNPGASPNKTNTSANNAGSVVKSKTNNVVRNKKDSSTIRAEQLAQQQLEQKKKKSTSVSLWDYVDSQAEKYTIFQSFSFHPKLNKVHYQFY